MYYTFPSIHYEYIIFLRENHERTESVRFYECIKSVLWVKNTFTELKITASQRSLTVVTAFVVTEKLRRTVTMTA